jgi:hypothetical protein
MDEQAVVVRAPTRMISLSMMIRNSASGNPV